MSYIDVDGINCFYKKLGNGKKDVILLHGWGQNTEMMDAVMNHLSNYFSVYNFDFPNFGKSEKLNRIWNLADYSLWLEKICNKLSIKNPIIIAHSFGCRVALYFARNNLVYKMVLTGAAGIKPKLSFKSKIKIKVYKFLKWILLFFRQEKLIIYLQSFFGSDDYKNAQGFLKQTFINIVNEDLSSILNEITVETLLVFGEKDNATPVWMGKKMESLMPNATLIIFENDDHYAYFNQAFRFNLVLNAFLKEDIDV